MRTLLRLCAATMLLGLVAQAARADTLVVYSPGLNYSNVYMDYGVNPHGGGNIQKSTLNGMHLPNLYCVDIDTQITPGTFASTTVTQNGVINGAVINNAAKVEWLLDNYADDAYDGVNPANKKNEQVALQAAIWSVIHGITMKAPATGENTVAAYNLYLDYMNDFTDPNWTAPTTTNWLWITPKSGSTVYQGLVGGPVLTSSSIAPEGGSLALLLTGLAPLGLALRRRTRR